MVIKCPYCGTSHYVILKEEDKALNCPNCGAAIDVAKFLDNEEKIITENGVIKKQTFLSSPGFAVLFFAVLILIGGISFAVEIVHEKDRAAQRQIERQIEAENKTDIGRVMHSELFVGEISKPDGGYIGNCPTIYLAKTSYGSYKVIHKKSEVIQGYDKKLEFNYDVNAYYDTESGCFIAYAYGASDEWCFWNPEVSDEAVWYIYYDYMWHLYRQGAYWQVEKEFVPDWVFVIEYN